MARKAILAPVLACLLLAGCGGGGGGGSGGSSQPTPALDQVFALPDMGAPQLVPQSLGGEYRALPESAKAGRGINLRLRRVPNPADVAVFVDGAAIPSGSTASTLPSGQTGVFSATARPSDGADVTVLLPLAAGDQRKRTEIAVANTPQAGRLSILVDTPSAASLVRPEASDYYFCTNHNEDYFGQPVSYPCLSPDRVVAHDVLVAGWLLSKDVTFQSDGTLSQPYPIAAERNCGGNHYCEDIHYFLLLDPSFLDRTYNQPGVDTPLTGAHLPGVSSGVPSESDPVPYTAQDSIGGGATAVTINSFSLQGTGDCAFPAGVSNSAFDSLVCIKGEQPTWHIDTTPPLSSNCFCRHMKGLGPPPPTWRTQPTDPTIDPVTAYPFSPVAGIDPITRGDASTALRFGDYVIAKATLWQDSPHGAPGCYPRATWDSGWLEIHSIDWIQKAPPPARPAVAGHVAACGFKARPAGPHGLKARPSSVPIDRDLSPPPGWFMPHSANDTLHYCTLIDERFTTLGQVNGLQIRQTGQTIHVGATLDTRTGPAAFTASIVMWWAAPNDATLDPACQGAESS
jgi:hypothetical protein